jgi:hypothetical protein
MSRSLIIGIFGTLIVIAVLSALFYQHYIKSGIKPLHHAIPNSSILFIESENWNSLYASVNELPAYSELNKNPSFKTELTNLYKIDSLLQQDAELFNMINGDKTALSMHAVGKRIFWFAVIQTKNIPKKLDAIIAILNKQNLKVSKRLFEKHQVLDAYQTDGSSVLSVSSFGDFLFLSSQGRLVEDAIRKLKYNLVNDWKSINKPYNITTGKSDHNIYVNYANLQQLFSAITIDSLNAASNYFSTFASWSVFQPETENKGISFTGATYTDDSVFQFLDVLNNQRPVSADKMFAYLPSNTAFYQHIGIQDYAQYKSDLNEFNDFHLKTDSIQQYVNEIKQKSGFNLDDLAVFFGENHFLIVSEFNQGDVKSHASAIIQIVKPEQCIQTINQFATKANSGLSDTFVTEIVHTGKPIYYIHAGKLPAYYFGSAFNIIEHPYVALYDEALIMSNTLSELKSIIDRLNNKDNMESDQSFVQVIRKQKVLSNYSVYVNTSKAYQIPYPYYEPGMLSMMNIHMGEMKKLTHLHVQYASANDKTFYTGMYLAYDNAFEEDTRMIWTYQLDTTARKAPELVTLGSTKGVFVQDVLNQCYLFDESGNLKWKVKLNQAIISEVTLVNLPPTNTKGYLFNTSESVYLLNENGNNLQGYPVRLPGKTRFGLSLIDWYGDSTYEYYLVLDNKRIAGYQLSGRILPSWTAKPIADSASCAISFIHSQPEKLLVCNLKSGVQYYSLNGKRKDSVLLSKTNLPVFVYHQQGTQHVIWSRDSTNLYLNTYDTSMLAVESKQFATVTSSANYVIKNNHLFIHDQKKLTVWRTNGEKMFEVLADSIASSFSNSLYSKGIFYGFIKYPEMLPILLNAEGKAYTGLPIGKLTTFTIGNNTDNTQKLMVGTTVNAQLILYRLK